MEERKWKPVNINKLKKDNSNLWRVAGCGELNEELKKLKFKKVEPAHIDNLRNWVAVTGYGITDPYEELDQKLDLMKFAETLHGDYREVFDLFIENIPLDEIGVELGISKRTLYRKMSLINQLYKEFYED